MDFAGLLVGFVFAMTFAVYGFRVFPGSTTFGIFKALLLVVFLDLITTILLRDFLGYGWENEINAAVIKWGPTYGYGFVLSLNHLFVALTALLLAFACNSISLLWLIYVFVTFTLAIHLWLAVGWNLVQIIGRVAYIT